MPPDLILAASGKPLVDHRVYTIRLRKMGEFIEVFDRLAMPILLQTLGTPLGFWSAVALSALLVGLAGIVIEVLILRRIYKAPELFQLLATFALVLVIKDAALWFWGPEELLGPRAPGLAGTFEFVGQPQAMAAGPPLFQPRPNEVTFRSMCASARGAVFRWIQSRRLISSAAPASHRRSDRPTVAPARRR